jgi:glycosyltransferase involved in cell wall biosynthesis
MKFHIVVVTHNFAPWIEENIRMLMAQNDADFKSILVDDMSTDGTVELALGAIGTDDRFRVVVNEERKFKARNIFDAIAMTNADDSDVIVLVDGDDKLADELVLSRLRDLYSRPDCWMTYGSFLNARGQRTDTSSHPYAWHIIRANSYRKNKWLASHLKTFRYGLWKRIRPDAFFVSRDEYRKALRRALLTGRVRSWREWRRIAPEDLHDPTGRFIRRVDDKAFTYPMLEMAGEKAIFVEQIMYVYNQNSGRSSVSTFGHHHKKWLERLVRDVIRHKEPYARLDTIN